MPDNVYVSLDHDDPFQKAALGLLIRNRAHSVDFHDRSVAGNPEEIACGPDDPDSRPLRDEITRKLQAASCLVVLIGEYTYMSDWTNWEINTFYELKKKEYGGDTWRRIRGMRIENCPEAIAPSALVEKSTEVMAWDPGGLDKWLSEIA